MEIWKEIQERLDLPILIAGPCAVESEDQMRLIARILVKHGVPILRGGAFKPRTSPTSFQGLGVEGLKIIKQIGEEFGLMTISEIMDPRDFENTDWLPDIIQIGSRNMQNFALLKEAGRQNRPVLLKRGMAATVHEWLQAAAYIENEGNSKILLCERGIRTVTEVTRNTLDLGAVAYLRQLGTYPIIVDPSHAAGVRSLVVPLAKAGLAAGAQGLMVEIHPSPDQALSDGEQSLTFVEFEELIQSIRF
jgi:3-deoxy-7-phosphoheptulonate synthase